MWAPPKSQAPIPAATALVEGKGRGGKIGGSASDSKNYLLARRLTCVVGLEALRCTRDGARKEGHEIGLVILLFVLGGGNLHHEQRHHGIRSIDLLHDFKSLRSLGRVGAFTVSGADVASQVVSFALVFALILPRWQPWGHRVVDLGSLSWWRSPGRVGAFTVSGADVAPPQLGWVARRAAVILPRW